MRGSQWWAAGCSSSIHGSRKTRTSGRYQLVSDWFRGLSNAFGVFETHYSTTIIPHSTTNSIAWIGSIQSFLTGLTGVFGGWVIDSGRYRLVLVMGTFLEVFGMLVRECVPYEHPLQALI